MLCIVIIISLFCFLYLIFMMGQHEAIVFYEINILFVYILYIVMLLLSCVVAWWLASPMCVVYIYFFS